MGKVFATVRAFIRFQSFMLLHMNPQTSSVASFKIALVALIRFIASMDMFVLLQKFVIVESFTTNFATILIIPSVLALVMT